MEQPIGVVVVQDVAHKKEASKPIDMIHMFAHVCLGWLGVLGDFFLMNHDVSKKSHRSESWRFELTRKEPSIAGKKQFRL